MNFSISEIIVILLIALLVIKPEQLPEVAYSIGRLLGWLRSSFAKVKEEVSSFVEPTNERKPEQQ